MIVLSLFFRQDKFYIYDYNGNLIYESRTINVYLFQNELYIYIYVTIIILVFILDLDLLLQSLNVIFVQN